MKKYELVADDTIEVDGIKLFRIRATRTFGGVEAGDLGGYVQSEANLSQSGRAWVSGEALVFGGARVSDDAWVSGWEWQEPFPGVEIPVPTLAPQVEAVGDEAKPQPDQDRSPGEGEGGLEKLAHRFDNLRKTALEQEEKLRAKAPEWVAEAVQIIRDASQLRIATVAALLDRAEQAEARLREVEAERDAAIKEADRLKAAHRQAEQQLRSLLTDLQGEAERIIDSGAWETPAAAAGRLEELIRKYAALASTEQKGAGR